MNTRSVPFATDAPRLLVIRRNRMGDMIYTLPLLYALRRSFPKAHLAVACDAAGEPIARACEAVDEVIVLETGWSRWLALLKNASRLRGYDCVVAVKGGFDRRLALLTRLSGGAIRIGFVGERGAGTTLFTHAVAGPEDPHAEHQIETVLRLLQPLGVAAPEFEPGLLRLSLPPAALAFAERELGGPFARDGLVVVNLSCNRPVKFHDEDYRALIHDALRTGRGVAVVGAPEDRARASVLAGSFGSDRVIAPLTPGPLELAALLRRADLFVTPEGGAAHLSSATETPTVVLWAGHYGKWRPRGPRHVLVEARPDEARIPVARVQEAMEALLAHGN